MIYELQIRPPARKELLRLEEKEYTKIFHHIESLKENQYPYGFLKLQTKDMYRIRVGRFRVIYIINEEEKLVEVVRVSRRNEDTYKGL
jgi:mRNA interferase RelE/StbE